MYDLRTLIYIFKIRIKNAMKFWVSSRSVVLGILGLVLSLYCVLSSLAENEVYFSC